MTPLPGSEPLLADAPAAPQDSSANSLMELLHGKGYEGVGLRYESPATIDLLTKVFSDSHTSNRVIAFVYTGVSMSYDPAYKSLTVGGNLSYEAIIKFIEKHVPAKPAETKDPKAEKK